MEGNKCDQPLQGLASQSQGMDVYAKDKGFAGWFNVSARDNVNVEKAADFLIQKILDNEKWKENNLGRSLDFRSVLREEILKKLF